MPKEWELIEAIQLVRRINEATLSCDYAVGLTGSVLFKGYSNKDLDLILYPLHNVNTEYERAINVIMVKSSHFRLYVPQRDKDEKLVFMLMGIDGRRIDVIIPSISFRIRNDYLKAELAPKEIKIS